MLAWIESKLLRRPYELTARADPLERTLELIAFLRAEHPIDWDTPETRALPLH